MSETKHSPSPWHDNGNEIEDATGKVIGGAISEQDARLMTAAPELLAALESLMLAAENLDPQSGAPIGYDELLKAIGAADAVRQKARGAA